MDVQLTDFKGTKVFRTSSVRAGLIARLLPPLDDRESRCLRFIDPYGFVSFNRRQMGEFVSEWVKVRNRASSMGGEREWEEVYAMADLCAKQGQMHLKFISD